MRRLSYGLLMLLLLVSCRQEDLSWTGPFLELTLTTAGSDEGLTKAESVQGDDAYHENLISTVEFFFYPGEDTLSAATYHYAYSPNKRRSEVLRMEMSSEDINKYIFPSATDTRTCTVFAVVNFPGNLLATSENTLPTLPELREREVLTNFLTADHKQPNFLMSAKTTMALRGRNQVVAGAATLELVRYACKLTVGVNVVEEVVVGSEVWEPMVSGMEVYLVNAVDNVSLAGEAASPSYVSHKGNPKRFGYEDLEHVEHLYFPKEGDYYQTYPTYMYPQHWVYGSTKSPKKEPYLKLIIPWKRKVGGQKQYYYKIVIPDDIREAFRCRFVRNNWYHIDVDVSLLGAEVDEASTEIEGTCYIVYWQDKNVVIKDAKIGNARYLSVDRTSRTLYNVTSTVNFSYVSSHPVIMKDLRAVRPYFGTKRSGNVLGGTIKKAGADDLYPSGAMYLEYAISYDEETGKAVYTDDDGQEHVWFENTGSAILFNHTLINDYTDPLFDYSIYKFHYYLVHRDRPDDTSFRKEQTIEQFPAIYIESTPNPAEKIVDNKENSSATDHGYVYVNGGQYTEDDYNNDGKNTANLWKVVTYNGGGTDMYKISTTVLPSTSEFIIGDPRSSTVFIPRSDYIVATESNGVVVLEDDGRASPTLTYYYPTDESSRTKDMIAPEYRISTKLSGTYVSTKIDKEQAIQRCAAFQENGFPAGRWRLPTRAEVTFAAQLSANEVFDWQFSDDYWSANGVVNVNKGNGVITYKENGTSGYVRCVYDSWYWGDDRYLNESDPKKLPNIFVWGDRER